MLRGASSSGEHEQVVPLEVAEGQRLILRAEQTPADVGPALQRAHLHHLQMVKVLKAGLGAQDHVQLAGLHLIAQLQKVLFSK